VPKAPSFQFYPADWLKDHKLKRCSFKAKGVWIDILSNAFECPEKGLLRDENGPYSRQEILAMLTGRQREKREGFNELVEKGVIKQLDDKTYYSKRMYEQWRLSEIRSKAGSKGGNPSLLLKQNPNKTDKQILTPSSSSSSSSNSLSKDKQPPVAASDHFETKVGTHFENIKSLCDSIELKPNKNGRPFNPFEWVQQKANQRGHPEAIEKCLTRIDKEWDLINSPWGYIEKVYTAENQNANEREAIAIHEKMKQLEPEALKKLTAGIMESI